MNSYCERLSIVPPSVDELAARGNTKLFHLLVATLLEHGAPMDLEQVIARLERAGVQSGSGKLSTSVKRAWRGRLPVYRVDDGRIAIDVSAPELERILAVLENASSRHSRSSRQVALGLPPRKERSAPSGNAAHSDVLELVLSAIQGDRAPSTKDGYPSDLKRSLIELCRSRASEGRVRSIVTEGFEQLGVSGVEDDLRRLVTDRSNPIDSRSLAVQVIGRCDAELANQVQAGLSPVDAMALVRADIAELARAVLVEADNAYAVGEVLRAAPVDRAMEFAAICGQARRDAGVPAAAMYRTAIRQTARVDLREALIRAVVDEGGLAGEQLVLQLLEEAQDPRAKRALRGALMRLRTRTAELVGSPPQGEGRAWISACDGQGAYWVLALLETPRSGPTLVQACVRAGRDLRDVMVAPRATHDELEGVMAQLGEMAAVRFVEAPLDEVARSMLRGARQSDGRSGRTALTLEMLGAVAVLERAVPGASLDPTEPEALRPRGGPVSAARARRLLARREYLDSWFFAEEDLSDLAWDKVGRLSSYPPSEVLRIDSLRGRLVAMADHMARFHQLDGDREAARLSARLARDTERNIDSALARVMLEQTDARLPADLVDLAATEHCNLGQNTAAGAERFARPGGGH